MPNRCLRASGQRISASMGERECLFETAQVEQRQRRHVCSISPRACQLQNTWNVARCGAFQSEIRALTAVAALA